MRFFHPLNRSFFVNKSSFALALVLLIAAQFSFAQTASGLSLKDRLEVFNTVWEKINKKYYDAKLNGVNWSAVRSEYQPMVEASQTDPEFYGVIKKMVGEMNDAHTRFLTPREAQEFKNKQGTTVGILLGDLEGKKVVVYVMKDSEADKANIRAGMTVKMIDGRPITQIMAEAVETVGVSSSERAAKILANRKLLEGEPETIVRIGLTDENGKDLEVNLTRKTVTQEPKAVARKLDSGFGYITLNTFRGNAFDIFKTELEKVRETNGLIIDLRYNGGGSIAEVLKIAGLFEKDRTSFGKMYSRSQRATDIYAIGNNTVFYSAPVVILVNEFSASGSELLASGLQETGRAKIIGSQSCGCLLGISQQRELKGGSVLHLSEAGFLSANNKIYEKVGVTPDKAVPLKIEYLQTQTDEDLIEAENYLTKK